MAWSPNTGGGGANPDPIEEARQRAVVAAAANSLVTKPNTSTSTITAQSSAIPFQSEPFVDPYAAFDPAKMAAAQFDPQYALLQQQAQQATQNYTKAGNEGQAMYDALAKEIAGRTAGQTASNKAALAGVTGAYGGTQAQTNASYEAAKNQIIAMAQRTGTMQNLGPLLAGLAARQMELNTSTGQLGANATAYETAEGQRRLSGIAADSAIARQGGINTKNDFTGMLQAALQQLGNKRLELQGEQGKTRNDLALQIAGLREQARNAFNDLELRRAGLYSDLEKSSSSASTKEPKDVDPNKLSPFERLAYNAQRLYPNVGKDTQQAAVNAITDTLTNGYKGDIEWENAQDFVQAVLARNPKSKGPGGDSRNLEQMATEFYKQLAGGVNEPYGAGAEIPEVITNARESQGYATPGGGTIGSAGARSNAEAMAAARRKARFGW